jgi:hypothetical protein
VAGYFVGRDALAILNATGDPDAPRTDAQRAYDRGPVAFAEYVVGTSIEAVTLSYAAGKLLAERVPNADLAFKNALRRLSNLIDAVPNPFKPPLELAMSEVNGMGGGMSPQPATGGAGGVRGPGKRPPRWILQEVDPTTPTTPERRETIFSPEAEVQAYVDAIRALFLYFVRGE